MLRFEVLVLAAVAVVALSACNDQPTASQALCVLPANGGSEAQVLATTDVAPLLTDAAERLGPALGGAGEDATRELTQLATIWTNGSKEARCASLNGVQRALALLPDDQSTAADRAALTIVLDIATASLAAGRE